MAPNPASDSRVSALDLLRFAAAMAVTLYHFVACYPRVETIAGTAIAPVAAVMRYGYLGVDLFFMISGFVILWSSWNRSALDFAISRISRLFPAFWASLAFAALLIYWARGALPQVSAPSLSARTLAANATMVPAVFHAPLVESVYWTLEIEVRFYGLIFLLLLARRIHRIEPLLYAWLALTIASLVIHLPWAVNYLALVPYGAFFTAGCLFYLMMSQGRTMLRLIALSISLATCIYVSLAQRSEFVTADRESAFVVPCLVVAFFGLFSLLLSRRDNAPSRLSYALGALTYPLYLTHATMGLFVYELLQPKLGVAASLLIITLLALAVAVTITLAVDIPARKPFARLLYRAAGLLRISGPRSAAAVASAPGARGSPGRSSSPTL